MHLRLKTAPLTSDAWKSPSEQTPHLLAIAISDRDPKFTKELARILKSDGSLVEDQDFNILLAGDQELGFLFNRYPESQFILARKSQLAHGIARNHNYDLARIVVRNSDTVRIFAADGSNKCIKRYHYGTGEVANIYSFTSKNVTETPVNVLLPDPYNDEKLFIIVWAKISHESVFTLVLLACKDND